jgi:hypothetical protein
MKNSKKVLTLLQQLVSVEDGIRRHHGEPPGGALAASGNFPQRGKLLL